MSTVDEVNLRRDEELVGPGAVRVANPILRGFNPDPSIARRGSNYYIATSTFEWFPAVQIHRSVNLADWELAGHVITDERIDLRGVPASGGVWAPCLSVDPQTGRFYLVFSIMKSQVAEAFDVDNYVVWADDIEGPWSQPLYLTSVGFDASLFHDGDGSKWVVTLEWETRDGREHPGWIVIQSFDPATGHVGEPIRISHGSSDRGAAEGPHLYKRDGLYYLMTAEGGTGFGHGVCLARSAQIEGPYQADPQNPIITSWPRPYFGRNNRAYLREEYFNPATGLQKAGHGSLVDTPDGRWYVAHLSARTLPGTQLSVLGRETSVQNVEWNTDGWLRLSDGSNLAKDEFVTVGRRQDATQRVVSTDFAAGLDNRFATLRGPAAPGWLRTGLGGLELVGRDSLFSVFDVSLVATRLEEFDADAMTTLVFDPVHFSQSAGLVIYYDNKNFVYARVTWDEAYRSRTIGVTVARGGQKIELPLAERPIDDYGPVGLRAQLRHGRVQFAFSSDDEAWQELSEVDISHLSDERAGGFTGTFVGLAATDGVGKKQSAVFREFSLVHLPG
ncbi:MULTISPECIES: glycoside hydrolase family 43 protein [unclassified Leifsonia]|uniref:glycoside hydrolase family 43 protein n=1 Tax=unclassified Leifsonia TaxID=2663824 RepID=UPI0008A7CB73|nr:MULTISPECIES: glycoside hydrolase family 43 protein [unclassified Leifsonia]SEI14625.1 xylan 1,4-beta-xylosidase [Leifsonia sp. CL154]SFM02270.1 xylan 1,4-beta-xylosidase [Leifsonia sp. CL147]